MSRDSERITGLLSELIDLSASERAARIEQLRAESAALADELESLLAAHDAAGGFLQRLDATRAAELLHGEESLTPPERAGPWRLVREIGRGGLGVVYLAERDFGDPGSRSATGPGSRSGTSFEQRVAVKLIKRGMDSELILKRFHHERRILASLEHPNIARLIDGGMLEDGRPYFAMEFIEGVPISTWCDEHRAGIGQRLKLFEQVCRAVQYAHARLIVHRDLKPANILVCSPDGGRRPESGGRPDVSYKNAQYQVKLLDFGIAKLLDEEGEGGTTLTVAGMRAMTPEYAAPEQVRGEPVSAATDVYALGVVLYELLAGHHPYRNGVSTREGLAKAICDTAPTLPSAAVTGEHAAKVAEARNSRPKALRRRLHGDLDNVVLKAMAKDPGRRYGSAEALAEDVRRHLDGLPVKARRETFAYRASRFMFRHRAGVAATAAVILALAGGLAAALWQAGKAREQAEIALRSKDFVVSLLRDTSPAQSDEGVELRAVDLLRHSVDRVDSELGHTPALQAELRGAIVTALLDLGAPEEALPLAQRASDQLRAVYGPDSRELAEGLHRLARVHGHLGAPERGEAPAREALAILDRLGSEPDSDRTTVLDVLAQIERLRGRYDEALALYQRALSERTALLGPDDSRLASIVHNVAAAASQAERYAEAEAGFREAGRLILLEADEEHPHMAYIHLGLGVAHLGQGRLRDAESELDEARRIAVRRLGADSTLIYRIDVFLAQLRRLQGRPGEARGLLEQTAARAADRGIVRDEALARLWLGLVLLPEGETAAAQAAFARYRVLLEESDGQQLAQYNLARVGEALVTARQSDPDAGRRSAETALARMRELDQDTGQYYAEAAELYAEILTLAGEHEQAGQWFERAVSSFQGVFGEAHPRTRAARETAALRSR